MRRHFFSESNLPPDARILETGCGSGAVLEALRADGRQNLAGIDIDLPALSLTPKRIPYACADGLSLPFADNSFDACLSHFYLLWVTDTFNALKEMRRVTHAGGWLAALAEPDYGSRVDQPAELEPLGKLQTRALMHQGADPFIGSRLPDLLAQVGLVNIHSGVLARQEDTALSPIDWQMEWDVLKADLRGTLDEDEMQRYQDLDRNARQAGTRVLHVPMHFAFGQISA